MFHYFDNQLDLAKLDRAPFKFGHKLLGHPALSLENLARALPALPSDNVFYSSGLLRKEDDFDRAHLEHRNGLSLEATIETIRTGNSYIMVRAPELHASFQPLFRELLADVDSAIQRTGRGTGAVDPMLYLFIASPNSLTPFHIDRYSTFLLQFCGSKQMAIFPPWEERVVCARDMEGFVMKSGVRPVWKEEIDGLAQKFDFGPGEAIHIPFVSGHYVKNGPSEVSISMSIIFNSARTEAQTRALSFNWRARPWLSKLSIAPYPVGRTHWRDMLKAKLLTTVKSAIGTAWAQK